MTKPPRRNNSGKGLLKSLLILVLVMVAMLLLGANFFSHSFIKSQKQYSPIEKAALSAGRALGKIVINTPETGYVSLSNQPPDGTLAVAEDGYSLPIRGINDLLATVRVDLLIADSLEQPLMIEFCQQDYKKVLAAKRMLVSQLKAALTTDGIAKDKNGNDLKVYDIAESAYIEALGADKEKYTKGSLTLSLGSLKKGMATTVKIPEPAHKAEVKEEAQIKGYYKSYTNVPLKELDFIFGGIGSKAKLVTSDNWVEEIKEAPYQFPTIVKASIVEKSKTTASACAQPACENQMTPFRGALTISMPDGPVPEIKKPKDLYTNTQLNTPEIKPMNILTASGGDYPVDSGSFLEPLKFPINNTSSWEPTASVWKLALYDWIRRAGPLVNIDSVTQMQNVTLDLPKPKNLLWKAPLIHGGEYVRLQPISSGIIHIFDFDSDGIIDYRSKIITPYPFYASSNNQLYGKGVAALAFSEVGEKTIHMPTSDPKPKKLILKACWDAYIRDEIRHPGTINGGKHGGEPLAMPVLTSLYKNPLRQQFQTPFFIVEPVVLSDEEIETARVYDRGKTIGYQPLIAPQSDLGEGMNPNPPFVKPLPYGRGARPLQVESGTAVDIRFRRQIDVSELNGELTTGYFGIVQEGQ